MTYEEVRAIADQTEQDWLAASDALKVFPRMENGLTPDEVKSSQAYRSAQAAYNGAFARLRRVNAYLRKHFPREFRAHDRSTRKGA